MVNLSKPFIFDTCGEQAGKMSLFKLPTVIKEIRNQAIKTMTTEIRASLNSNEDGLMDACATRFSLPGS